MTGLAWPDAAPDAGAAEDAQPRPPATLTIDIDGFEGPLDLLLQLSRQQKIDLRQISILQLADQYLAFVRHAVSARFALAADYLVMAAWLALLKSRLLLPEEPDAPDPDAEELAAHLRLRLEHLELVRNAARNLFRRPRLGEDVFPRGHAEEHEQLTTIIYETRLFDIIHAYARLRTRDEFRPFVLDRPHVVTMDKALERLRRLIPEGDWHDLMALLPPRSDPRPLATRSALAAHFAAVLELARHGEAELQQEHPFACLKVRKRAPVQA